MTMHIGEGREAVVKSSLSVNEPLDVTAVPSSNAGDRYEGEPIDEPAPTGEPSGDSGSVLRGGVLLLSGKLIAVAANIALQVIIVRYLSKESYGALAYGIAAAQFLTVIVSLGMEQTMSHYAAKFDDRGEHGKLRGAIVVYISCVAVLGALSVVMLTATSGAVQTAFNLDDRTTAVLAVMVLLAPLQALDTLWSNLFAVFGKPASIFWRRYVITPALKIATAIIAMTTDQGIEFIAGGFVVASLVGLIAYAPSLVTLLRSRNVFRTDQQTTLPVRQLARFTAWAIAADLVIVLLFFSDVFMVQLFGTTADVATLQSVQPLANGNLIAFYAVIPLFLPGVTRLFDRGDTVGAQKQFASGAIWVCLGSFPVAGLTIAYGPAVATTFFGEDYAASGMILTLLAAGQYITASFGLTGLTLKAKDRLPALAVLNAFVAVLNIGLNIYLINIYGALGAAAGTLISFIVLALGKSLLVRKQLGFAVFSGHFTKVLASVTVGLGALALLHQYVNDALWFGFVATAIVGLVLLRVNRRALDAGSVFPEVLRIPVLGKLLI